MRQWWGGLAVAVAVMVSVMGWSFSASADQTDYGIQCWRTLPFEDRLHLQIVGTDEIGVLALYGSLVGQVLPSPPTYVLNGGGVASIGLDWNTVSINIPMHNVHPTAFGGHPICRITAIVNLKDFTGPGVTDCIGSSVPGKTQTPFIVPWTLQPVKCDDPNPVATSPGVANSRSSVAPQGGRLMGE